MTALFDPVRFLRAQEPVLPAVRRELAEGRKQSHWMWFVFPQLAALGRSETARFYGIASLPDARAYLAHPVLGPRLVECAELVNRIERRTAHAVFGSPDDLKLRSSMTLFGRADPAIPVFRTVLERYFEGRPDPLTVARLEGDPSSKTTP